jgi:hypothetical protein
MVGATGLARYTRSCGPARLAGGPSSLRFVKPASQIRSCRPQQLLPAARVIMVGATGFEPATLCSQSRCATRLRYTPINYPIVDAHSTHVNLSKLLLSLLLRNILTSMFKMNNLPNKPWGEHLIEQGKSLVVSIDALNLHLFRRDNDLLVVEKREKIQSQEKLNSAICEDIHASLWQSGFRRYAFNNPLEKIFVRPLPPARAVVVRPRESLHLAPAAKIDFYVSFPLDYQLYAVRNDALITLERGPTTVLSDTWFGDSTHGHIAFSIKTRAQRDRSTYKEPDWGRGIVRMTIHNEADTLLRCDKFSLRLAHCALYEGVGEGPIWASSIQVNYRGADSLSALNYSTTPPPYLSQSQLLSTAEEPIPSGLLRRTFGRITGAGFAAI